MNCVVKEKKQGSIIRVLIIACFTIQVCTETTEHLNQNHATFDPKSNFLPSFSEKKTQKDFFGKIGFCNHFPLIVTDSRFEFLTRNMR